MAADTVFSKTLQKLRKERGTTQEQLATYLGVSPQAVSKWENGSYPEGDLLPKISEYFGVSISYLYGQEKEERSLEQQILDEFQRIIERNNEEGKNVHPEYFDKMFGYAWAFHSGCWKNNKTYQGTPVPEKGNTTAASCADGAGFGYFALNKEKQFFIEVKEPDEGFVHNIPISETMRDFFVFLGEKGALEMVYYLLTLKYEEYVTVQNIADRIGFGLDETQRLLDKLLSLQRATNPPFYCINVIGTDGSQKGLGVNPGNVFQYISLFLVADSILNPPFGFNMQVSNRNGSWFDREKTEEMLKKGKTRQ